jgi:hypothetical protein
MMESKIEVMIDMFKSLFFGKYICLMVS